MLRRPISYKMYIHIFKERTNEPNAQSNFTLGSWEVSIISVSSVTPLPPLYPSAPRERSSAGEEAAGTTALLEA